MSPRAWGPDVPAAWPRCVCRRLVQEYPQRALSWFAVGCYYMCTRQYESARRYFGRATTADPNFAPAWVGFGNAFALQDESDQVRRAQASANCPAFSCGQHDPSRSEHVCLTQHYDTGSMHG